MPAKIPFLPPSETLQQRWKEASSSPRVSAQIYVFALLITVGLLHHYVFAPASRRRMYGGSRKPHTYGSASAIADPGAKDETLGQIDGIYIYPIKSCAGVSVDHAQLTTQGFDLDRRWMVVAKSKKDPTKLDKISLREEPRLTLIQPQIDHTDNVLRLKLSDQASKFGVSSTIGETETVLRPTPQQLQSWRLLPKVEMYGDFADGRVAQLSPNMLDKRGQLPPSEWISEFLGYPVLLIHFDTTSEVARDAFPIFKPPSDTSHWAAEDREELERKRGIEFQDEYPLLVATKESLLEVQAQLQDALEGAASEAGGDGRGGRTITELKSDLWTKNVVSMQRFRPNIIVRSAFHEHGFGPFSEDSWERMWILPPANQASEPTRAKAMLQLVARCQRCLLTAVDPVTAEKDPSVPLKLLNRSRMRIKKPADIPGGNGRQGPCFGMYAVPLPTASQASEKVTSQETSAYGSLQVGDSVRVRWRPYSSDDEPRGQQHD
ncbi:hypothetical protein BCV70DRAFT_234468 [Testicularia cyperi]|uniref:MOSC domain-containing protein n=1 Tax=Testicularia cyperi TaxID=1882483 RepID=A0A317XWG5_9BASI|nr:hypothetical protein BCV70DRAFT_234468 [Testicularia cyperi]